MARRESCEDVQAILRVRAGALDHAYLRHWAAELSIGEVLEVALRGEHPPAPGADPRQQRLFSDDRMTR